jgi:hypothetical protein
MSKLRRSPCDLFLHHDARAGVLASLSLKLHFKQPIVVATRRIEKVSSCVNKPLKDVWKSNGKLD